MADLESYWREKMNKLNYKNDVMICDVIKAKSSDGSFCTFTSPVHFPIEVRFVRKDDVMITPNGDEDVTYIGIVSHRPFGKDVDHDAIWDFFEELVMNYKGKPHWAKLHKADEAYLRKVYQNFDQFMEIRERLDPDQVFFNPYWNRIFSGKN